MNGAIRSPRLGLADERDEHLMSTSGRSIPKIRDLPLAFLER